MPEEIVCYLPHETLVEQAAWIREWLDRHRSQMPRMSLHSRISRLCAIVESTKAALEPNDRHYREVRHAVRDVQEMRFILQTLAQELFQPPFRSVFELVRGDSVVPSGAERDTAGRDAQFELLVAAVFKNGGMVVNRPDCGTADWCVSTPAMRWVAECKRIKNLSHLENHVRKAAGQIHSCELRGMMILDVSLAFTPDRPSGQLDQAVPDHVIDRARRRRDGVFMPRYIPRIQEWCNGSTAGLVLLRETLLMPAARLPTGLRPWGAVDVWTAIHLRREGTPARDGFNEISHLFDSSLPRTRPRDMP